MHHLTPEDLLFTAEAAEALSIERSTLTRWVAAGRIAPFKKAPATGGMIFLRSEVERVKAELQGAVA